MRPSGASRNTTCLFLTDDSGLQIDEDRPWNVFPTGRLREECIKRVILRPRVIVIVNGPVGPDAVLEAIELPAGIAHLDAGLANMNGDHFTHFEVRC